MSPLYRKVEDSDILVVASPVFFGTVTAQLKALIDRFHCVWISRNVLKKKNASSMKRRKGVFLCAAADKRRKYFERSKKTARIFFNTVGARYAAGLFCGGVEGKGGIVSGDRGSKKAFSLGQALAGGRNR
jgi:multimeric flavodoxin WrbA